MAIYYIAPIRLANGNFPTACHVPVRITDWLEDSVTFIINLYQDENWYLSGGDILASYPIIINNTDYKIDQIIDPVTQITSSQNVSLNLYNKYNFSDTADAFEKFDSLLKTENLSSINSAMTKWSQLPDFKSATSKDVPANSTASSSASSTSTNS